MHSPHYYLAYAREFRGEPGTAMKEMDRALALDPSKPEFYDAKAAFYWVREKPKQAVQVLRDCVAAVPASWRNSHRSRIGDPAAPSELERADHADFRAVAGAPRDRPRAQLTPRGVWRLRNLSGDVRRINSAGG